jgi:hypothetical protein
MKSSLLSAFPGQHGERRGLHSAGNSLQGSTITSRRLQPYAVGLEHFTLGAALFPRRSMADWVRICPARTANKERKYCRNYQTAASPRGLTRRPRSGGMHQGAVIRGSSMKLAWPGAW